MSPMSSTGSPTAVSTMIIVTSPPSGTPAAPIAARVAVTLQNKWRFMGVHSLAFDKGWFSPTWLWSLWHGSVLFSKKGNEKGERSTAVFQQSSENPEFLVSGRRKKKHRYSTYAVVITCPASREISLYWAMKIAATASYRAVPSMLMVAPTGKTKRLIVLFTPAFSSMHFNVTGSVAELRIYNKKQRQESGKGLVSDFPVHGSQDSKLASNSVVIERITRSGTGTQAHWAGIDKAKNVEVQLCQRAVASHISRIHSEDRTVHQQVCLWTGCRLLTKQGHKWPPRWRLFGGSGCAFCWSVCQIMWCRYETFAQTNFARKPTIYLEAVPQAVNTASPIWAASLIGFFLVRKK